MKIKMDVRNELIVVMGYALGGIVDNNHLR